MRPKKSEDEKYKHTISLRLTDEQMQCVHDYETDWSLKPTDIARLALVQFLKREGYHIGGKAIPSGKAIKKRKISG